VNKSLKLQTSNSYWRATRQVRTGSLAIKIKNKADPQMTRK